MKTNQLLSQSTISSPGIFAKQKLFQTNYGPNKEIFQESCYDLKTTLMRRAIPSKSLQYNYFSSFIFQSFIVNKVDQNSPAQKAGLQPKHDFIIGLKKYKYEGLDELISIICDNEGQDVELIIFNAHEKSIRSIVLKPQRDWGGRGLIGCEFAGGFLNQLPIIRDETNMAAQLHEGEQLHTSHDTQHTQVDKKIEKSILSLEPPPFDVKLSAEAEKTLFEHNQAMIQNSQIVHSHHIVNQLLKKQEKKHNQGIKEVTHNKDPFSINKSPQNISQEQTELFEVIIPEVEMKQNTPIQNTIAQTEIPTDIPETNPLHQDEVHSVASGVQNNCQVVETVQNRIENITASPVQSAQLPNEVISHKDVEKTRTDSQSEVKSHVPIQNIIKGTTDVPRKKSDIIGRVFEFDQPNSNKKYVILEQNLFPVNVLILRPNLLLDENIRTQKH